MQSDLEAAKQAAALTNTQASRVPEKVRQPQLRARGCERSTQRASNQIGPGPIGAQGQAVRARRRAERTRGRQASRGTDDHAGCRVPKNVRQPQLRARGSERSTQRASNQIGPRPVPAQGQAVSAGRRAERTRGRQASRRSDEHAGCRVPKKGRQPQLRARGSERATQRASNQIGPGPIGAQGQAVQLEGVQSELEAAKQAARPDEHAGRRVAKKVRGSERATQ